MSNDEIPTPPSQRKFETTHWSLVLAAGRRSSPDSQRALTELCEKYWYPLYAYVRKRVPGMQEAQDLTQAFFAKLLDKNYVADADPQRGKFRTFLLSSLAHFLANEWDKARAKKRGGDHVHLSLDFHDGERRFSQEPTTPLTAERVYDRHWGLALLGQVLTRLREEYAAAGKEAVFARLEQHITPGEHAASYAEAAEELQMSNGAVKVAVHRLRRRYGELLRVEIAQTVADPGDVDQEIRGLFETFSTE